MPESRSRLGELWFKFESIVLIPIFEVVMRLRHCLDPRVYFRALRIIDIVDGRAQLKSNKYAIFVIFAKGDLPQFTMNFIDAVTRSELNLVIVSNLPLDLEAQENLLNKACLVITRKNVGRDFGAYKDAISIVSERFASASRIVLANDSLFYFEHGIDSLIERLDGTAEFIGVTEVFEHHYHVQSFMLSFGPATISSPRFRRFWKRYLPISTRRWSIHKGEVELTRQMTKAGLRPEILFYGPQLIDHLRKLSIDELSEATGLLPTELKSTLLGNIVSRCTSGFGGIFDSSPLHTLVGQSAASDTDDTVADLRQYTIKRLRQIANVDATLSRVALDSAWREIISTITSRNQIHVGGFLFMKYLGLTAIKRDILYRGVYTIEEIYEILGLFDEPLRDEVLSDLRRNGTPVHFGPLRRMLFNHGSI